MSTLIKFELLYYFELELKKEIGIEKTGFCTFVKGVTKPYDLVVDNKQKKLLDIMSIE